MRLPTNIPWEKVNTLWASAINPFLANPLLQGNLILNQVMVNGSNSISHKLGRMPRGWYVVDQNASANFYRSQPFNSTSLILTSSAACTISLWVF